MLDILNGLSTEAYAGATAFVAGVVGAIIAAVKGKRKTPQEVGAVSPDTQRTEYVLQEVRTMARRLASVEESSDRIERHVSETHVNVRILMDRG